MGASIGLLVSGLRALARLGGLKSVDLTVTDRHASEGWHPNRSRFTHRPMQRAYIYIMTNKPFGTLYIGVTGNLPARIFQHRNGSGSYFCRKYSLDRLVYIEDYATPYEAIAREKAMKAWKRRWKTDLIIKANPEWRDLWNELNA